MSFWQFLKNLFKPAVPIKPLPQPEPTAGVIVRVPVKDSLLDKFYARAKSQLGVHEIEGRKSNQAILEYSKSVVGVTMTDDSTLPWCSIFVCWVVEKSGVRSTRDAMARSWLRWGRALETPIRGCVVVLWRGEPGGPSGHVGFYDHEDDTHVYLLGGNQGDEVSIAGFPKYRVLGFRAPN